MSEIGSGTQSPAIKERPILFSPPMVRAIRERRKTQTRRIMNPQPEHLQRHVYKGKVLYESEHRMWCWKDLVLDNIWDFPNGEDRKTLAAECPLGKPGDRLWVREAWQTGAKLDRFNSSEIAAKARDAGFKPGSPIWYKADGSFHRWGDNDIEDFGGPGRYRHARFMPRWASRITLEITEVRVQRLTEISCDDALAEGVAGTSFWREARPGYDVSIDGEYQCSFIIDCYRRLWQHINGAGSWATDPFVWSISFRVIKSGALDHATAPGTGPSAATRG